MNDKDRQIIRNFTEELDFLKDRVDAFGGAWDANTKSILELKDEIHELQPRYHEIVKLLKFQKADDIQPNLNRRNTDNRGETMSSRERRSRPKIISFFGLGRLNVEL